MDGARIGLSMRYTKAFFGKRVKCEVRGYENAGGGGWRGFRLKTVFQPQMEPAPLNCTEGNEDNEESSMRFFPLCFISDVISAVAMPAVVVVSAGVVVLVLVFAIIAVASAFAAVAAAGAAALRGEASAEVEFDRAAGTARGCCAAVQEKRHERKDRQADAEDEESRNEGGHVLLRAIFRQVSGRTQWKMSGASGASQALDV